MYVLCKTPRVVPPIFPKWNSNVIGAESGVKPFGAQGKPPHSKEERYWGAVVVQGMWFRWRRDLA